MFTRASHADHSLRERTFFYCSRSTHGEYPIKCKTSARGVGPLKFARTLYLLWADLYPSHVDRLHSSGPQVDFSAHSRFTPPFSPRSDLIPLLAKHAWREYYQMYGPLPAAFDIFVRAILLSVMRGPLYLARGPFSLIMTPSGQFCSLALHATILSVSGPFSVACVENSILSNVRTSPLPVGHFSFARTFCRYGRTAVLRTRTVFIHQNP